MKQERRDRKLVITANPLGDAHGNLTESKLPIETLAEEKRAVAVNRLSLVTKTTSWKDRISEGKIPLHQQQQRHALEKQQCSPQETERALMKKRFQSDFATWQSHCAEDSCF
jgi:hypothetical protein